MRNPFTRFMRHARDFCIWYSPLSLHTSSGLEVRIKDRASLRLYEYIFIENAFKMNKIKEFIGSPAPMVFDIGANCGLFTFKVLDLFPDAEIFVFEPNVHLIDEIKLQTKNNGKERNVFCHSLAVGKTNGQAVFYQSKSTISSTLLQEKAATHKIIQKSLVNVVSIDNFVASLNGKIDAIDILKIDVEGAEIDVLKGAHKNLSRVKVLLVEYHPPFTTAAEIEKLLGEYGLIRHPDFEPDNSNSKDLAFIKKH